MRSPLKKRTVIMFPLAGLAYFTALYTDPLAIEAFTRGLYHAAALGFLSAMDWTT